MKGYASDTPISDFNPTGLKANKNYTIAVVVKSQTAPVWESHLIAAEKAGKDMGVTILKYAPTSADNVGEQTSMLEDIATKGVDCVVLAPANSAAVQAPVASLVAKGIPVVYDNTLGAGDDYLSFIGVDSTAAGTLVAKTIAEKMGGKGKLLLLEGVPGQQTSDDRVKAAKAELDANWPGISYKSVVANWKFDQGQKAAEDTLQSWPDLGGIVSFGGNSSEGAAEAVAAAGKSNQVIIGAFDVQAPTVADLVNGKEAFTISQNVYAQGYYSVAACVMALNGQTPPRQIRTPLFLVNAVDAAKFDESPDVLKQRTSVEN
jgi:ABC-type sugar transport system substrate-binding protein